MRIWRLTGDDLLDTGVTHHGFAAGKKNSTISNLLSVGKRALTAFALVFFHLSSFNPSPFCMLGRSGRTADDATSAVARMLKRCRSELLIHLHLRIQDCDGKWPIKLLGVDHA